MKNNKITSIIGIIAYIAIWMLWVVAAIDWILGKIDISDACNGVRLMYTAWKAWVLAHIILVVNELARNVG